MNAPDQFTGPIGIIAGGGGLPATVARAAQSQGRDVFIIALEGFADPGISAFPGVRLRMSQASRIIASLRQNGCREVVMVGSLKRPTSFPLRDVGLPVLWLALRNLNLLMGGDASVLNRMIEAFENAGFVLRGAHEIATQLVVSQGLLGLLKPNSQARQDIERGLQAALVVGELDIGQGVVVARGRVLAVEAVEGTDRMLARVGEFRAMPQKNTNKKPLGVLVKCPQPIQDRRVDMPTIGPATVRAAAAAGLAGIAIVAGQVLVADPEETRQTADDLGLFVEAVALPGEGAGS